MGEGRVVRGGCSPEFIKWIGAAALGVCLWTVTTCSRPGGGSEGGDRHSGDRPAGDIRFVDVTAEAGVEFDHEWGARGRRYMPETMVGGAGWLDADGDGRLDLYLVNGNLHSDRGGPGETSNRLYRNLGDGSFRDVTDDAGVGDRGYGCGLAVGDYDNDGLSDLYVTNLGRNVLYHNEGGGRFRDVTASAGVGTGGWSSSAAFVDVDGDGLLDLFVCQYVDYDPGKICEFGGLPGYCSPKEFPGLPDRLYRNLGEGEFEDISEASGVAVAGPTEGKSLGVVTLDYDADGDQDIYVACDHVRNLLHRNRGDGRFDEVGLLAGVAYSAGGQSQAGMGVDAGDVDLDGHTDLVVTNFSNETNALYRNDGGGVFRELGIAFDLGPASLIPLGFGVALIDVELDGDLDLYVGNGHVSDNVSQIHPTMSFRQQDQLLENLEGRRFRDISSRAGPWFRRSTLTRAVAPADFDDDGDEDLAILLAGSRAVLLRNESAGGHWVAFKLVGSRSPRDGYGARLLLTARGGERSMRRTAECRSTRSYLAAGDPRVRFGLGPGPVEVDRVEVRWPSGTRQEIMRPGLDRVHVVEEPGS